MKSLIIAVAIFVCLFNIGKASPINEGLPILEVEKRSSSKSFSSLSSSSSSKLLLESEKTYIVKKDDSLWSISQKMGCSINDIIKNNRKKIGPHPDLIFPNMVLLLPSSCNSFRLGALDTKASNPLPVILNPSAKTIPNTEFIEKKSVKRPVHRSSKLHDSKKSSKSDDSGFDFSVFNVLNHNSDYSRSRNRDHNRSYARSYDRSYDKSYEKSYERSEGRSEDRSYSKSRSESKKQIYLNNFAILFIHLNYFIISGKSHSLINSTS